MSPAVAHVGARMPRDMAVNRVAPVIGPTDSALVAEIADLASDLAVRAMGEVHTVAMTGT